MTSEASLGTHLEPPAAKKQKLNGGTSTSNNGTFNGTNSSKLIGTSGCNGFVNGGTSMANGSTMSTIDGEEALKQRKEHLAPSQKLFYEDVPLHIVRGKGAYFYDAEGQCYLDTTNNVACVGHSHPRITEACAEQMAVLCTNSRFLNERIVTYAKRLCSTFPEKLSYCFFTNSGSEANDLALQLGMVFTGRDHIVSLVGCYHGHLTSLKPLSNYKYARGIQRSSKFTIASLPDIYRGQYQDKETAGTLYAKEIKEIVDHQKEQKDKVGVFIHESMLSCAGQVIPPKGYLKDVYKYVHDAGGVVIADEIQTGFGRMGNHFWAFQAVDDVCPDIVTVGKPMGNGHPVSAVITTKEIAEKFASSGVEYFNTFGGNPVSMAIAEAVLDVIEDERLQQNAKDLGEYLMKELLTLKDKYECVGDVRGTGLFIGIDIVKSKDSKERDAELAKALKYRMLLEHKIIVHVDGIEANVIKIKPPLVISRADCTHFLQSLDSCLAFFQN